MKAYVIWSNHYLKVNLYMIKEFMPSNVCIFPRSMCHGAFSYNSIIQSMSNIDNVRRQMFSCILWSFSLDLSYCEPNEFMVSNVYLGLKIIILYDTSILEYVGMALPNPALDTVVIHGT